MHDAAQLFLGLPQGQGASLKSPPLCFDAKALLDKLVDPLCSHAARCFALRKAHLDLSKLFTPMLKLCVLPGLLCGPHSALESDVSSLSPQQHPPCCVSGFLSRGSQTDLSLTPGRWTRPH